MVVAFLFQSKTSTFASPPSLRSTRCSVVFRACRWYCCTRPAPLLNFGFNSLQICTRATLVKLLIVSVDCSYSVFDVEIARLLIFNFSLQVPLPLILKSSDLVIVDFRLEVLSLKTLSLLHLIQKKFVLALYRQRVEGHFWLCERNLPKSNQKGKFLQLRVFGFLMKSQAVCQFITKINFLKQQSFVFIS